MRLPEPIRRRLLRRAQRVMASRSPDFIIGTDYLRRWWLIPRNRWFNVYLHQFNRSDDDRALHDHPWPSCSIILDGFYLEHLPADRLDPGNGDTIRHYRDTGDIHTRAARAAHRIELIGDDGVREPRRAITLFLTGPKVREWGFFCPKGWRHWQVFTSKTDSGQVGRGCD